MKLPLTFLIILLSISVSAQTLIAVSNHHDATANYNQRKIVRDSADNIYVVYQDVIDEDTVIISLFLDRETEEWSEPVVITTGKNPSLAISKDCKFVLVYESNQAIPQIIYRSSEDFNVWTDGLIVNDSDLPCRVPVTDVDELGSVNVFWLNGQYDDNLFAEYARIQGDTISLRNSMFGLSSNISIANHLQYNDNKLFVVIESPEEDENIIVFSTDDYWETWLTHAVFSGKMPSVTYNSYYEGYEEAVKVFYLNSQNRLFEAISVFENNELEFDHRQTQSGVVDFVCVDDIAHPIGNSYLFMKDNNLYHSFSYGSADWFDDYEHGINYDYDIILDTVSSNPYNPSIAYKHFRFSVVDYIWTEEHDGHYYIYYKRDDKYDLFIPNTISNNNVDQITASPNPFTESTVIDFSMLNPNSETKIRIYNDNARLLFEASITQSHYFWDGKDMNGNSVKPGVYVVLITSGNQKIAGKLVKN